MSRLFTVYNDQCYESQHMHSWVMSVPFGFYWEAFSVSDLERWLFYGKTTADFHRILCLSALYRSFLPPPLPPNSSTTQLTYTPPLIHSFIVFHCNRELRDSACGNPLCALVPFTWAMKSKHWPMRRSMFDASNNIYQITGSSAVVSTDNNFLSHCRILS